MTPPLSHIVWRPAWRIIPSRFPPIDLFERIAAPEDLEAVIALESLTNPRLRDEVGTISLVPPEDRVSGPGTSIIMAAFTHPNPSGSRFSDGSYGVFYAAGDLDTAIAETRFHREAFLRATQQPRLEIDMRVYLADLEGELHDIRGHRPDYAACHDPQDYAAGQQLARRLRRDGSNGIAYHSVRRPGGDCVAVFRPPLLSGARQERHLCYVWDGQRIGAVYEKREV
ncbi:RES family NAD+ phosphorylase [Radicibacter daui]|uniref:RES family NAD+ phosphorylase n=1 Tax=Radicibacter daui TaxID=3064829 RepID=UPI00404690E0